MNHGIRTMSFATVLKHSEVEDFRRQFFKSYPQLHIFFKQVVEILVKGENRLLIQ